MRTSLIFLSLFLCRAALADSHQWQLSSPDKHIVATVTLDKEAVRYAVSFNGRTILHPSRLGLAFKHQKPLQGDFTVLSSDMAEHDSKWKTLWGERAIVRDNHRSLTLQLQESAGAKRKLDIVFRVYNDGVAFRYQVPEQPGMQNLTIMNELTEFAFARNYQAWWIPAYRDSRYELQYAKSALGTVDSAHTPITLVDDGIAIAVHEAALLDYASMTLKSTGDDRITLTTDLVPWANGDKVYTSAPFTTPWRTIQIAPDEVALLNSDLLLNLNEPPAEDTDTNYVKPGKYMGIWWEMHIGEKEWSPGPKQGATTKRAMEYIDFAARHDIDGVLVEGWNKGWEGDWWRREPTFSFTQPVDGFDVEKVANYAREKGVELIGHHETSAGIAYYEAQMEEAFGLYEKLGVHSVKMGYVGNRLDNGEWHHGQFMVRHFNKVVRAAAKHSVMVNAHETIKPTGLRRTFPNMMTREAVRGMEYNGGSPDTGNLPNHTVIIPFTRGLAGPTDFTPGIFNFNYKKYRPNNRVPTTLAKQLALYVTLYSPLQMVADLPENYVGHPAFAFIDAVPTDWQDSRALAGEIGEYLVFARQDRHSANWYVGATTNEKARTVTLKLDFLPVDQSFTLTRYQDAKDAHWEQNPEAYEIITQQVTSADTLTLELAPGGGAALEFVPR